MNQCKCGGYMEKTVINNQKYLICEYEAMRACIETEEDGYNLENESTQDHNSRKFVEYIKCGINEYIERIKGYHFFIKITPSAEQSKIEELEQRIKDLEYKSYSSGYSEDCYD